MSKTKHEMTPAEAWRIFHPELVAVTVDNWSEEHFEEYPEFRQLAADIEAGNLTDDVLKEIFSCLNRDWCSGRIKTAALTVLAANNKLMKHDPNAMRLGRKPKLRTLLGVVWEV